MAILSKRWNLLFVMRGGAGCSSIGQVLLDRLEGEFLPAQNIYEDGRLVFGRKHNTIPELLERGYLTSAELEGLTTFTTVRNPFDQLASGYAREASGWLGGFPRDPDGELRPIPEETLARHRARAKRIADEGFETWLVARHGAFANLKRRVRRMVKGPEPTGGNYFGHVRHFVKFENLEEDFNRVLRLVGFEEHLAIPNVNPTKNRQPYQSYYTPRARRIVQRVYAGQLERFGYRFE